MRVHLTRRRLLQTGLFAAGAWLLKPREPMARQTGSAVSSSAIDSSEAAGPPAALPRPTAAQLRWQDYEVGVIFHFDLPVAARRFARNNTVRERLDPQLYNPAKLDTDQWAEVAKAAGARYAIFTATHFNGFMQWQSDLYPYGLKQAAWRNGKGDVVADFVASCRKAGIAPGIYLSTHRNVYWTVWGHYVDWGKGRGTPKQRQFNRIAEGMTRELCSRYGPLAQIWFDAGVKTPAEGGPDVLPIFEKYQPEGVFYHNKQRSDHRWVGNEQGHAGDPCWATMPGGSEVSHNAAAWRRFLGRGDPEGVVWSPAMVDVPLRGYRGVHDWFWQPGHEHGVEPLERLLGMYYRSAGLNCNLIIGVVISPEGLVPEPDARRLAEFGRAIRRRFGAKPVAETSGRGRVLSVQLPPERPVDHLIVQEDIAQGERVREFVVEIQQPSGRKESIGHKRIVRFEPLRGKALRLSASKCRAEPIIRRLAVLAAEDA